MSTPEDRASDINTVVINLEEIILTATYHNVPCVGIVLPTCRAVLLLDELKQAKLDRATLRNLREAGILKG